MNKKILKNLGIIFAVAAIASGITYAYFANPAKVQGNSFTTGNADLKIKMPNDGCPDWSDNCAGKTWSALYPGWHDSYEVFLKNESAANIALEVVPFIEETGSSQDLWNKSYMEITWSDSSHSTGRFSLTDWKTNSIIKLLPVLAYGQEAGPWVVKFDIDTAAGNEIAGASIAFNVVFDGVHQGGTGGGSGTGAVCGNGILEGAEVCDDGNTNNGDGCSVSCQSEAVATCGDGIVSGAEVCDDGNTNNGDGCSATCAIEAGFNCIGQPSVCASLQEVCNGIDDNIDGVVDEGLGGGACDGADSDLCAEGIASCTSGVMTCSDTTGSTLDICNNSDDDCDAASADGSEDPQNGVACDGSDSDLCLEGTRSCSAGTLICSDATSSLFDVCNGLNDDCDAASADGSEDSLNGTACDGSDLDLCAEGLRICSSGGLTCTDTTGTNVEICNSIDDDCDGEVDESCF